MSDEANGEKRTKHALIFDHVHSAILSGHYKLGQRIPSESQLSHRFKTTRVTVGKAMRELEHAGFVERRAGSGTYARMPLRKRSRFLGLLVPNLGDGELFEPVCSAIATTVRSHEFTLLWGHVARNAEEKFREVEQLCHDYIAQKVDGVFFNPVELVPGCEDFNHRIMAMLDRAGIAIVLLDSDLVPFPERSQYDLVGIDNRRAGYLLADHFIEQGRRRLAFVSRSNSAHTIEARIAGAREALFQHDLTLPPEQIYSGEVADPEFVRRIVTDGPPDAIVCGNDYTAAQVMQNLLALGMRVPEDVAVAGIDDIKYAQLLSIPLTTIHQPCAALGVAAVDAMIRRIENPTQPARDYLVDVHLVVRRSSCPSAELVGHKDNGAPAAKRARLRNGNRRRT